MNEIVQRGAVTMYWLALCSTYNLFFLLSLDDNEIGPEGAIGISEGLKVKTSLTKLV